MAGRYKPTHQKKKRRAKRKESSFLRTALTLCFCVLAFVFSAFLWREALRVSSQEQGSVSASGEAFRPQVGDPPYRVAIDAGHGGNNASGHRHGHGRRTNRDANQCRHNERNHDQRQACGRNCMLPFVPLALSKLWMMSSRVTWMPRCAVFSFKISSQCSYCAAVFDLSFPV